MLEPALARRIQVVAFDVDGVLTDGSVYFGALNGEPVEMKRFSSPCGLGVAPLRKALIKVVAISGRQSEANRRTAQAYLAEPGDPARQSRVH